MEAEEVFVIAEHTSAAYAVCCPKNRFYKHNGNVMINGYPSLILRSSFAQGSLKVRCISSDIWHTPNRQFVQLLAWLLSFFGLILYALARIGCNRHFGWALSCGGILCTIPSSGVRVAAYVPFAVPLRDTVGNLFWLLVRVVSG